MKYLVYWNGRPDSTLNTGAHHGSHSTRALAEKRIGRLVAASNGKHTRNDWRIVEESDVKKNPRKRGKLKGAAKAAFLARMAKGRKKVARVTRTARKKTRGGRRAARGGWKISARKGSGPKLFYTGERFSNARPAHLFPTQQAAMSAGRRLLARYAKLRSYQIAVESTF